MHDRFETRSRRAGGGGAVTTSGTDCTDIPSDWYFRPGLVRGEAKGGDDSKFYPGSATSPRCLDFSTRSLTPVLPCPFGSN